MEETPESIQHSNEALEQQGLTKRGSPAPSGFSLDIDNGPPDEILRLRDYWRVVRNHLWLVISITALVTLAITFWMAFRPDYYEARARVEVNLESINPAIGDSKNSTVLINTDPTYFNTQLQIISSPRLLRRVVKTLDLEHNRNFLRHMSKGGRLMRMMMRMVYLGKKDEDDEMDQPADEVPLTSSLAPSTSREDFVEANRLAPFVADLKGKLTVEPVKENRSAWKETRLIEILFQHPNPRLAPKIVNAIADAYVLSNMEEKTEIGINANEYLKQRTAELESQIRSGEERLINYGKNHQILSLDPSQNIAVDRLAGLNKQLLEAENDRKLAEANYRAAIAPNAARALAEENAKQITDAETKLAELRQRRALLRVGATEKWPEVKEIDKQIAVLEKQIEETRNRAVSTIVTNLETKYRQALAREQALRASFDQQRGVTQNQNEAAVNYRLIQQEIDTNKSLLNGLLQRLKENDVAQSGITNNITVIDYAITLDKNEPDGPWRLPFVMLAFILSLAFSIGLAFLLEHLDDTLRTGEEVKSVLQLPVLGIIPSVGGLTRHPLLSSLSALQLRNGKRHGKPELMINADSPSPLIEDYRRLRTSVLLSMTGRAPKKLLVTSSTLGEGKTTTVINLAVSLAQTGASVLVIDADMHSPRVHSIFNLENDQGLSTILSSEAGAAEAFEVIKRHEASGIQILPSGPLPSNPAELLGSEQMRRLIAILESAFTHIVIDSPSIASCADSIIISSLADGVLLVVHGGKSSREIVRHSQQALQDVGAKVIGVVLNNLDVRPDNYHYYYPYLAERNG